MNDWLKTMFSKMYLHNYSVITNKYIYICVVYNNYKSFYFFPRVENMNGINAFKHAYHKLSKWYTFINFHIL